ncbi:MAG TPA: sigma-70 family RNA polymerase sigma factor [Sedimentisphaerales bacterium]|nr:sigma-70 family RNA polymerase sigma factor [Sedimentisphaerales bacterium]
MAARYRYSMDEKKYYSELVKRAKLGDRASLGDLAELVRGRLYAYVYRIVLQEHLAQDIVQETMLEMFKVFGNLDRAERFWPWLRGIAFNKIRRHTLRKQQRKEVPMSSIGEPQGRRGDGEAGLAHLVGEELKEVVVAAMGELKPRHRKVLTMRCYEEMEYSEIAQLMGCSELGARVLFHRAKRSLQRALGRKGLGKGFLVTALVLFGKMTAPSEAAAAQISVTAATVRTGVAAGLIGMAGTKTAVVSLTTAGLLAVGTVAVTSGPDKTMPMGDEKTASSSAAARQSDRTTGTIEERWYYLPEGADGPVMTRVMKSDSKGRQSHCAWRENDQGNYHFDDSRNVVCIDNHRMWRPDLAAQRLPTDKAQLREFLSRVEGRGEEMGYVPAQGDGLLVIARREGDSGHSRIVRLHHVLDEEYFRYNWPAGIKTVDNRDAMHKRGWTYFRVEGAIMGQRVTGVGRIAFVYAACKQFRPWLRLQVGNRLRIVDIREEALLYDDGGKVVASYAGGSFFKGLARPWMGLHTIDAVRRDAAEQQVWFETKYEANDEKAQVVLTSGQVRLVYTIDMWKDVVEEITFSMDDGKEGQMRFSYLQEIDEAGDEFAEPGITQRHSSKRRESGGIIWLFQLANGGCLE